MEINYGWWAAVPPLVAIILCFATKRVLISLFIGILSGGIIISTFSGTPMQAVPYTLNAIVGQIADSWNANLLVFNLLMGSGIALIWKLNGSSALTSWARQKIKTRRGVSVATWLLGIVVFFNDYCNAAIVGNAFRDISNEHRISTEKLSFVLDATAAPVATLFISDWIAFQIGMLAKGLEAANITADQITPLIAYAKSIPLNMYCIMMVIFVGMIAITQKDYGKMLEAERRAVETGKVIRDGGASMLNVESDLGQPFEKSKPRLINFFLPIGILVVVTLFGFYVTGLAGMGHTPNIENTMPVVKENIAKFEAKLTNEVKKDFVTKLDAVGLLKDVNPKEITNLSNMTTKTLLALIEKADSSLSSAAKAPITKLFVEVAKSADPEMAKVITDPTANSNTPYIVKVLENADAGVALVWGAFAMTFTGLLLGLTLGSMKLSEVMDTIVDGMKLMLLACVILVLAWSMGGITSSMKLSNVVIATFGDSLSFGILPIVIFVFGMGISFSTGTSWGTMTILTPIAIPLAYQVTKDVNTSVMMAGVVFSGAIFGDHCSPISDTTVLASIFSGADHIDHTFTQIPYALTVAFVTAILLIIYGFTQLSPFILMPLGLIALYFIIQIFGKKVTYVKDEE